METTASESHPAEIERETMKRMAQVQAQIIEELSQSLFRLFVATDLRQGFCQFPLQKPDTFNQRSQIQNNQHVQVTTSVTKSV